MSQWVNICNINDILPATGVCALLGNEQRQRQEQRQQV